MNKITSFLFSNYHVDELILSSLLVLFSSSCYFSQNNLIVYLLFIISLFSFILSIKLFFDKKPDVKRYSRLINFIISFFSTYVAYLYFYHLLMNFNINDFELLSFSNFIEIFIFFTILRSVYLFVMVYIMLLSVRSFYKELEPTESKLFKALPSNTYEAKYKILSILTIIGTLTYYFRSSDSTIITLANSFFIGLLILGILNSLPKKIIIKN